MSMYIKNEFPFTKVFIIAALVLITLLLSSRVNKLEERISALEHKVEQVQTLP